MAASLRLGFGSNLFAAVGNCLKRNEALTLPVTYQQQRGKKKKTGGAARNKKSNTKYKFEGPLREEGTFVYKGEWLVRQRRVLWYPGENVGIQKNNHLYALRDGELVITCERLNPYPDSPLHAAVNEHKHSIYKMFYNIYPIPVHAKFKLIE